jgi:hypothetical protein
LLSTLRDRGNLTSASRRTKTKSGARYGTSTRQETQQGIKKAEGTQGTQGTERAEGTQITEGLSFGGSPALQNDPDTFRSGDSAGMPGWLAL